MASNSFGNIFKITTWGESHGKAIGVVIDGCPAGLEINEREINSSLELRSPGRTPYTSPRNETDVAEILSGVFEGKTTGAPISIMIPNRDVDSSKYEPTKNLLKPGHANFTYLEKYGVFDFRGGGRASARETACRVAAGAVAKKLLKLQEIQVFAYIKQIGPIEANIQIHNLEDFHSSIYRSDTYCPDQEATTQMTALIERTKSEGDSMGGIVEFVVLSLPTGLGDPVYEKLEANLAHAMMSIPASKGFEIGSGFRSVNMNGSEHNDLYAEDSGKIRTETNFAGGVLAGISTGMPIIGRVAFKPPSSIMKPQKTLTTSGESSSFILPSGSRHDPCVAIRAVPVVEAMVSLVLIDAILMNRCTKL